MTHKSEKTDRNNQIIEFANQNMIHNEIVDAMRPKYPELTRAAVGSVLNRNKDRIKRRDEREMQRLKFENHKLEADQVSRLPEKYNASIKNQTAKKPVSDRNHVAKTRNCLKCQKPFTSDWPGNRLCRNCKTKTEFTSGIDE